MEKDEKPDWVGLPDLAARLTWAMAQMGMDDKMVAAGVIPFVGKRIPWQTIQSIRSGEAKSSGYTVQIAHVLKVDALWLAAGKGAPYAIAAPMGLSEELTVSAVALARRFQALPRNLQAAMFTTLLAFESLADSEVNPPSPVTAPEKTRP